MLRRNKILRVLSGHKVSPPPLWLLGQNTLGVQKKEGFYETYFHTNALIEKTLQPLRVFDLDAAVFFSHPLTILHALGQKIHFFSDKAYAEPLCSPYSPSSLRKDSFEETMFPLYEAIKHIREDLSPDKALVSIMPSPWTLAASLLEGDKAGVSFYKTKSFMYEEVENFQSLIHFFEKIILAHARSCIKQGVDVILFLDLWGHALLGDFFSPWLIKPIQRIIQDLGAHDQKIPFIGFPCGGAFYYSPYVKKTGVHALHVDSTSSLEWVDKCLPSHFPVQGHLDSTLLLVGGEPMKKAVSQLKKMFFHRPFIFNFGDVPSFPLPPDHVKELIGYVKT